MTREMTEDQGRWTTVSSRSVGATQHHDTLLGQTLENLVIGLNACRLFVLFAFVMRLAWNTRGHEHQKTACGVRLSPSNMTV